MEPRRGNLASDVVRPSRIVDVRRLKSPRRGCQFRHRTDAGNARSGKVRDPSTLRTIDICKHIEHSKASSLAPCFLFRVSLRDGVSAIVWPAGDIVILPV